MTSADDDKGVADLTAAILGADELQQALRGTPIPPVPPLSHGTVIGIWIGYGAFLVLGIGLSLTGEGLSGLLVGVIGMFFLTIRLGIDQGRRAAAWADPKVRREWLDKNS